MEKKVILVLVIIVEIGCFNSDSVTCLERAKKFYTLHKEENFDLFKCYNIVQWNPNRRNLKEEYHIEFYPNCQSDSITHKPLRGKVKFIKGKPIFSSKDLEMSDLPPRMLGEFYNLKVSSLFYKKPDILVLDLAPGVRLIRSCGMRKKGYLSIDSCWYYRCK